MLHVFRRMSHHFPFIILVRVLAVGTIGGLIAIALMQNKSQTPVSTYVPPAVISSSILYTFNVPGTIEEVGDINESKSPYWWLDSGGRVLIHDNIGETIQGELSATDPWYREYADTNPLDTEGGKHPQNLLRLVSRSLWDNVRVEASFLIVRDNHSGSENRNESNGLLLMSRYGEGGQTLYYTGIRVDGTAVIKKKYKGEYYTLAQKQIFPGTYDKDKKTNLLPHGRWIRLRSDTVTEPDGNVRISFFMQDTAETDTWKTLLSATDSSQFDNTPPITGKHSVGIRTDFMDVRFDDILAEKI